MRPPKFNFVPERLLQKEKMSDGFFCASITSNGQLFYNKDYIHVYEIANKFAEFYIDKEKRTIGWRMLEDNIELAQLNQARKFVPQGPKQVIRVSLLKLLREVGWLRGESYLKIPIEIYKRGSGDIHYVRLPDIFKPYERQDK